MAIYPSSLPVRISGVFSPSIVTTEYLQTFDHRIFPLSTVYKGRKKKTIEYFVCKSVEKSQKSKVLQEVRILHSLNHPNVLKFYAWYETSAHMWLVLEYCAGGDLRTLLQQDCKLPEDSVYGLKTLVQISLDGITSRDEKVFRFAREREILVVMLTSDGYMKLSSKVIVDSIKNLSRQGLF